MTRTKFLCYAFGRGQTWEAMCVDLDIGVQGRSFEEVRTILKEAIATYVEDASHEDAATAKRLLGRRAPWYVRAGMALKLLRDQVFRRQDDEHEQASWIDRHLLWLRIIDRINRKPW